MRWTIQKAKAHPRARALSLFPTVKIKKGARRLWASEVWTQARGGLTFFSYGHSVVPVASIQNRSDSVAAAAAAAACCFSSATTQKDPRNYALARVRSGSDAMATRLRRPAWTENGGVLVSSPARPSHVSLVQRDGTWLGWIDMHHACCRGALPQYHYGPWRGRTVRLWLGLALIWWWFGFFC
jgi:hypothetical protein